MIQEQILEGNKLIAEFMGWTYFGFNDERLTVDGVKYSPGWKRRATSPERTKLSHRVYLCRNHTQLAYRSSWDWLMPVIDKIGDYFNQCSNKEIVAIPDRAKEIWHLKICAPRISFVWQTVVEFIKWYNSNKQETPE